MVRGCLFVVGFFYDEGEVRVVVMCLACVRLLFLGGGLVRETMHVLLSMLYGILTPGMAAFIHEDSDSPSCGHTAEECKMLGNWGRE